MQTKKIRDALFLISACAALCACGKGEEKSSVTTASSSGGIAATLQEAIVEMSSKGLSMVTVVDDNQKLMGIITDGDLRRLLQRGVDVYHEEINHVMTKNPKWIDSREMAVNALQKMNDLHVTGMPVLNENSEVVGSIMMQVILKAGIIR